MLAIPVLLDACVLYPIRLRDTLLNVAEAGFFRVLWSDEILAETSRNIVEDVPGLTSDQLKKTFDAMRRAFPDAAVRGYEHLVDSMPNHPKDRYVLAAAVVGGARDPGRLMPRWWRAADQAYGGKPVAEQCRWAGP